MTYGFGFMIESLVAILLLLTIAYCVIPVRRELMKDGTSKAASVLIDPHLILAKLSWSVFGLRRNVAPAYWLKRQLPDISRLPSEQIDQR